MLNKILTRFGIAAAVLAILVLVAPVASAQSASECELDGAVVKCTYVENGEDPVATFSATDDDGDAYTWSLKADATTDYKRFAISNDGVLTFMSPPDFDAPGDMGKDNVYEVTVRASDGEREVEVTVTGINEPGKVTFKGNQQPQAGRPMTAEYSDEDGSTVNANWQWSKREGMDGDWENVKSTSTTYTPVDADIGSYLRATVSYTDVTYGARDVVSGVTKFLVEERPSANAPPKFSLTPVEVLEGVKGAIGTISGSDPDNDELTYRLWATGDPAVTTDTNGDDEDGTADDDSQNDNDRFTITEGGELKLKVALDFEQAAPATGDTDLRSATNIDGMVDVDGDGSNDDTADIVEYTAVITATDPSGATGSTAVIVHLLNVDEAPAVNLTIEATATLNSVTKVVEASVPENGQIAVTVIVLEAGTDPEAGTAVTDNTGFVWSLEGPDASKFDFDRSGGGTPAAIVFKGAASAEDGYFRPNFEDPKDANKDNKYEVTVVVPVTATPASDVSGKSDVIVTVTDANDDGSASISKREPQVGTVVVATLKDEDADITRRAWQWYRGGVNADTNSDGALSATEQTLHLTTISLLEDDTAVNPNNVCGHANTVGVSGTQACVVGGATSPTYSVSGDDDGLWIHVVVSYQDKHNTAVNPTPSVLGRTARVVQDIPVANTAPKFNVQDPVLDGDETEHVMREVDENKKVDIATFSATDRDLLDYELGGADKALFKLLAPSGESNEVTLQMKEKLDFEAPKDADGDNAYEVSITAEDPSGAADTLMVTIMVQNEDDPATITLRSASECALDGAVVKCTYVENGEDPVATFSATDDDGDAYTWSLKADATTDYKRFAISNDGVLTFMSPPDFDAPGDMGKDNVYEVTVRASDGEREVEVTVTGINEPGKVTFKGNQQPQAGRPMTAEYSDEDGSTVNANWQWSKREGMDGDWENVKSTSTTYTPVDADIGSYLRATVSYTDVTYGARDVVSGVTKFLVEERPSANAPPKFSLTPVEVLEGVKGAIGTISGSDPDNDELTYRLWATGDPAVTTDTNGDDEDGTADDDSQNDNDRFTITEGGELKLKVALDFEQAAPATGDTDLRSATNIDGMVDVDGDGSNDDTADIVEYTAVITATDPSGATGSTAVIVHLLNVDEAPAVNLTIEATATLNSVTKVVEASVPENGQIAVTVIVLEAGTDPEAGTAVTDNTGFVWSLEGPDASKFDFDRSGGGTPAAIVFKGAASAEDGYFRPNFEDPKDANKDNKYEVTVVVPVTATPASDVSGKSDVIVTVTDANDDGSASISKREPQVGTVVVATLKDEDADITRRAWQWYRGGVNADTNSDGALSATEQTLHLTTISLLEDDTAVNPNNVCGHANTVGVSGTQACVVGGATSPTYSVSGDDDGLWIHVVVSYQDKHNTAVNPTPSVLGRTARVVQDIPVANTAPKFNVQDPVLDGDETEHVMREVDENKKVDIGTFSATDRDLLDYELGGADKALFKLSAPSGESNEVTLQMKEKLDFEAPKDADGDNAYEVSITAEDPSGAADTLMVTIMVQNEDDAAVIVLNAPPAFASDTTDRMVEENQDAGTAVGDSVTASDVDGDTLTYTLSGGDGNFDIDSASGQITTTASLDYEAMASHTVTVTANDGIGSDSIEVTIVVIDNTPPAFASDTADRMVDENQDAGAAVGDPVTASDVDGDTLTYTLSGGDGNFDIDSASGQITTTASLDYETMASHTVTVTATDSEGSDSIEVTIMVIDNTPPAFPGATANRSVDENMYAGAAVGEPVAADDAGDTVTYTLSESMYFEIDENSGQITTTMTLDEEDMSSHMVTVTATDSEGGTDSVSVAITVNDSQPGCDTVGDMGLVNDCEALLDSEDALGGSVNWADDTPMSDWDGVTISGDRVTAVNLRDQGLDGTISAALGRLSELTSLNLRSNAELSGEIPGSLNDLSDLTVLNLHSNSHTGEIPDLSGTSLVELYLPGNELTGSVPAWLNTMTDMTELWLWGNNLSGTMPDLSGMTSLDKLKLNGNSALSGIDAAMLPGGLRWLIIGQTDIGANAPDLSGMMSLTTLWMNETGLSGVIPVAGIPTSLTSLNLKDNMLSGTIPDMSGLDNLVLLRLHRNQLSGDIPGTLGDLESIERIWAYDNDLTGIAAGFANADDTLTHLELRGNSFTADTCLPGDLADVANNDFEMAGLAACQ